MKNRKQKKLQYITLKNKLKGSLFYTHDVLTDKSQWADIYFLGKNKKIYNATIMTTLCHWHDLVESVAWDELTALTGDRELFSFKDGYIDNPALSELKGKTSSEFLDEKKVETAQHNPPKAYAHYTLLPNFSYGIGLDMVIDEPTLSTHNINCAIQHFLDLQEQDWLSDKEQTFSYNEQVNFNTNAISLD